MEYFAGIDLGGTKIYAIVINDKGKILSRAKIKTGAKKDVDTILKKIVDCYKEALAGAKIEEKDIQSVGMAVPSAMDVKQGILLHAPNLGWKKVPIAKLFKEKINKPVFIGNDVNIGTYGEYCFGAGKKAKNLYGLFIGTGIGGGYVVDGKIIRGLNFTAGEIGHMVIDMGGSRCNCGNKGCLETVAAKIGMIDYMIKKVGKDKKKTILSKIAPDWQKTIGSSALKEAYEKKDKIVVKAIKRSAGAIGIACANLINTIGIESIVIGGGVMEEMGDVFMPIIRKKMDSYAIGGGAANVKLLKSALGDDAVALGAAWYARLPENKELLF
ncbi:MAG: ROK family protein [Spirochaetales bacterium]|nr:ROK family protein [Spirochaetales bacterium]